VWRKKERKKERKNGRKKEKIKIEKQNRMFRQL
jgi:hypothetical protein